MSTNKPAAAQAESLPLERQSAVAEPEAIPSAISLIDGHFSPIILKKLLAAQVAIEKIEKDGRNTQQGYDYVSAANVLAHVRKALHDQKLIPFVRVDEVIHNKYDRVNKETGQVAGVMNTATAKLTFTIYDTESGEFISSPCEGDGMDTGDKAVYKAITGATKYAALGAMGLSSTDDPENEGKKKGKRGDDALADGDAPKEYISMKAKWPNTCAACGKAIDKGSDQVWLKGTKLTYCPGCVPKKDTPPASKPSNTANGDLANPGQVKDLDAYFAAPKRDDSDKAWWADVKETCLETVTTARAEKMLTWFRHNPPTAPIPKLEWESMLRGEAV